MVRNFLSFCFFAFVSNVLLAGQAYPYTIFVFDVGSISKVASEYKSNPPL